jgi:hypothetical protein
MKYTCAGSGSDRQVVWKNLSTMGST